MKRISLLTALLIFALCLSSVAQRAPSNSSIPTKKVTISGKISQDGKAIVADGKAWIVSNIERLQNHLGEHVTVKGFLDPVTNRLEVLSIKILRNEVSASARLGDSAFLASKAYVAGSPHSPAGLVVRTEASDKSPDT